LTSSSMHHFTFSLVNAPQMHSEATLKSPF
jgi:hypothetical protein